MFIQEHYSTFHFRYSQVSNQIILALQAFACKMFHAVSTNIHPHFIKEYEQSEYEYDQCDLA